MSSQKKAMIVNGSPRLRGNTNWLCTIIARHLQKQNIVVNTYNAVGLKCLNNGCIGCYACQRSKDFLCVFKDDVQAVVGAMPSYDIILFATPVYFFAPSAQTKLVMDRMFSLLKTDKDGNYLHPFTGKTKFGLIVTAGGEEKDGADLALEAFRRTAETLGQSHETLVMPLTPMGPEELDDADRWIAEAEQFAARFF